MTQHATNSLVTNWLQFLARHPSTKVDMCKALLEIIGKECSPSSQLVHPHAQIKMANPSIFTRIPTEIVVQIVTDLVNDPYLQLERFESRPLYSTNSVKLTLLVRGVRRQLKNLRLTHRRFATLDCINALLFDAIQLEVSRAGLLNLQNATFHVLQASYPLLLS